MALNENTRPYEILIRIHPDGSVAGQRQTITEVFRDEDLVASAINAPEELTDAQKALAQQMVEASA